MLHWLVPPREEFAFRMSALDFWILEFVSGFDCLRFIIHLGLESLLDLGLLPDAGAVHG